MRSISIIDDDATGEVSVTFRFSQRDVDELSELSALLQVSRSMAPSGTRLGIEIDAHIAFCRALEAGERALAADRGTTSETKGATP